MRICLAFFISIVSFFDLNAQIEDVYLTSLKEHLNNIVIDSSRNSDIIKKSFTILKSEKTSKIPKILKINGEDYKIKILDNSEIKQAKITSVIFINNLEFNNQSLSIDVVDFSVGKKSTRKKLKLINLGGTIVKLTYDCMSQEYLVKSEYFRI